MKLKFKLFKIISNESTFKIISNGNIFQKNKIKKWFNIKSFDIESHRKLISDRRIAEQSNASEDCVA